MSKLLNTAEAASFLRVSEASIRRWADAGTLPSRRVGGRRERRFTESDLVQFLNRGSAPQAVKPEGALNVGGTSVPVPGHLATFHSSDAGGLRLSVPFLADGLRSGQPCFLAAKDRVLQRYLETMAQQEGLDLSAAIAEGRFKVVALEGTSENVILIWEHLFAEALATGAAMFRLVGEMESVRAMFTSEAEMLRFEEAFDVMFKRYSGVALCQYDVRAFGGSAMLRALKAHPDLYALRLGTFLN